MVGTPREELDRQHLAREKELERRRKEVQFWMRRDAKKAIKLREYWKQRDQQIKINTRLFDYICTICNRPFATPRKLPPQNPMRCYPCTRFMRLQAQRTYRRTHPEKFKAYDAKRKRNKPQHVEEQQPHEQPSTGPQVVWHVEE